MTRNGLALLVCIALLGGVAGAADSRESVDADTEERLALLSSDLADGDRRIRLRAVSALTRLDGQRAAAARATVVLSDADPEIREEAVLGLRDLAILEQALLDPEPRVREAVAAAIGDFGGVDAARVVASALTDEEAAVREEAVHALAEIGGEVAVGLLQLALTDERPSVREAAAEALSEIRGASPENDAGPR